MIEKENSFQVIREAHATFEHKVEKRKLEEVDFNVKTKYQRIIEAIVTGGKIVEGVITNGRGYARLPSNSPIFYCGDPLKAWLYFAEKRNEFNESEYSTFHGEEDKALLIDFLAAMENPGEVYAHINFYSLRNGREVEQVVKKSKP